MKYIGMPMGMWFLFHGSFKKDLVEILGYDAKSSEEITGRAKRKYKEIIASLPEFEKEDRFTMNIVNCALLAAFYLQMDPKPDVERIRIFYNDAMMTPAMKWFCKKAGKKKFSEADIEGMKKTAAFRAADRNPYSWNMEYIDYGDESGYEARFTACGICTLMKELGIYEVVPAMCALDYTMAQAGGASEFVREYTLASGGPYCDCGYKKKKQ